MRTPGERSRPGIGQANSRCGMRPSCFLTGVFEYWATHIPILRCCAARQAKLLYSRSGNLATRINHLSYSIYRGSIPRRRGYDDLGFHILGADHRHLLESPTVSKLIIVFLVAAFGPISVCTAGKPADQRLRFLASQLDAPIDELDKGECQLPLLLETHCRHGFPASA